MTGEFDDDADFEIDPNGAGEDAHQPVLDPVPEGARDQNDQEPHPKQERRTRLMNRLHSLSRKVSERDGFIARQSREIEDLKRRFTSAEVTQTLGTAEATVETKLSEAKQRYAKALADGDHEATAQANADIARHTVEQQNLRGHRRRLEARDDGGPQGSADPDNAGRDAPAGPPEHVRGWLETNEDWFNVAQDATPNQRKMTARAIQIEDGLKAKGLKAFSPRMLAAIDQQMRKEFGDYFDDDGGGASPAPAANGRNGAVVVEATLDVPQQRRAPPASPAPAAAPARASGAPVVARAAQGPRNGAAGRPQVRLTQEHIDQAQKMGLTPQQYAAGALMP